MRRAIIISFLLCFCALGLRAQEPVDKRLFLPPSKPELPSSPLDFNPSLMRIPDALAVPAFETKEQRAQRINLRTYNIVMESVDQDLYWNRLPKMSKPARLMLGVAPLFLSNPYGIPEGYVSMMNPSFPFIYAKTPALAPYDHPYSSDNFPKCIESEYDSSTGTYKQVMVDWKEYQKKLDAAAKKNKKK